MRQTGFVHHLCATLLCIVSASAIPNTAGANEAKDAATRRAAEECADRADRFHSLLPLLEDLEFGKSEKVRCDALDSLAELSEPAAVKAIIAVASDPNDPASEAAIEAIEYIHAPAAMDFLIAALAEKDSSVGVPVARCLGSSDDPRAVKPLIGALRSKSDSLRAAAAESLGMLPDSRVVDPLIHALDDPCAEVRREAAAALAEYADRGPAPCRDIRVLHALIRVLKEEGRGTAARTAAAEGLMHFSEPRAADALLAVLRPKAGTDSEPACLDSELARAVLRSLALLKEKRAAEPMLTWFESKNVDLVCAAAWFAWKFEDERFIDPLLTILNDRAGGHVRESVVSALGTYKSDRVINALVAVVEDKGEPRDIRFLAITALGRIGDTGAAGSLIACAQDETKKTWMRCEAIKALAGMRKSDVAGPLEGFLTNDDQFIRSTTAEALSVSGAKWAVGPLVAALRNEKETGVERSFVKALGRLHAAEAVDPLVELLGKEIDDDAFAVEIIWALGEIGDARAFRPLIAILTDAQVDPDPRFEAASSIGMLGDPKAFEPLHRMLYSPDLSLRWSATQGLKYLKDPRAVERLIILLKYQTKAPLRAAKAYEAIRVQEGAAEALGEIGDVRAVEPLKEILKDETTPYRVREAAEKAVEKIGNGTPESRQVKDCNGNAPTQTPNPYKE